MQTVISTHKTLKKNEKKYGGLKIPRYFTKEGKSPFDMLDYELRSSIIRNPDGSIVFESTDIEVPKQWSQVATDILAQKYFRKAGVPLYNEKAEPLVDESGKQLTGSETSLKQVTHRMAGCWRYWGEQYGYFETEQDAQVFYDELVYMLISQTAAPNSPQWFNTGLNWAYGISGPPQGHWYTESKTGVTKLSEDAYTHPQPHACFIQSVNDDLVREGGIFDLVVREARIFKYGSGTGSNFSKIRGKGERLSGGGTSSGLMSFLKVNDVAAGSIKSGGTTRRAAKMVCLDIDHPEIETFIDWKVKEEQKVAMLVAGSKNLKIYLEKVIEAAKENADHKSNPKLAAAIKEAVQRKLPLKYVLRSINLVKQGREADLALKEFDTHYESDAYITVSGQNSNNSVRIPNEFFKAVEENSTWNLINRTDGGVNKTLDARKLWDKIGYSAWACADPGTQYDTTINEWHTCPNDGKINASNPCSEYMFLDDTACNLASINLGQLYDSKTKEFDIKGFKHAVRIWTIVLEVSVLMAQFPSRPIAELSFLYRTLGLGYANLGSTLMKMGIPYDSPKALAIAGATTAIMCGESYAASAEMAKHMGPFEKFANNRNEMLRVIRNHKRAAHDAKPEEYEGLTITPQGIKEEHCPTDMLTAAREAWDKALESGSAFGFRNAQVTVLAPTGTIGLVMDCDTTGVEPDFALVKFKKLAGGGYFKIVNQSVPSALDNLNYTREQVDDIIKYLIGHATLRNAPHINHQSLKEKGFTQEKIDAVEAQLSSAFELKFTFNKWTLGEDFCKDTLKLTGEQLSNSNLDMLKEIGFTKEQIDKANDYVCGNMTVEGAPHLKDEHLAVFDCANPCGKKGKRCIHHNGHIRMMAAAQPFITGAISKTINMPHESTIEEVQQAYITSWKLMNKSIALYRDGCKLSQPLSSTSDDFEDVDPTIGPVQVHQQTVTKLRDLPSKRSGLIHEVHLGGQPLTLRTSEFTDGQLAELQIDMFKQGSTMNMLLKAFAHAVSKGLQAGVPLNELVDEYTFQKFDPQGMVYGHEAIKSSTSVVDFIFRTLGYEYLDRTDFVHVKDAKKAVKQQVSTVAPLGASTVSSVSTDRDRYKSMGYTGDTCGGCGSMKVKRNGACTLCDDCGSTSGCS